MSWSGGTSAGPYPRLSSATAAATRAASLSADFATCTNALIAVTVYFRASARTSLSSAGRPPGLPH